MKLVVNLRERGFVGQLNMGLFYFLRICKLKLHS